MIPAEKNIVFNDLLRDSKAANVDNIVIMNIYDYLGGQGLLGKSKAIEETCENINWCYKHYNCGVAT